MDFNGKWVENFFFFRKFPFSQFHKFESKFFFFVWPFCKWILPSFSSAIFVFSGHTISCSLHRMPFKLLSRQCSSSFRRATLISCTLFWFYSIHSTHICCAVHFVSILSSVNVIGIECSFATFATNGRRVYVFNISF